MIDGTHILDGSFEFGTEAHDVVILTGGMDPGSADTRAQDVENPVADATWFGRDFLTGPSIQFTLGIRDLRAEMTGGPGDMWAIQARLAAAWRADRVRSTPGALSSLVFQRAGRVYRVWGRPRGFGLKPSERADDTYTEAVGSFKLAAPTVEYDQLNQVTAQLLEASSDGGLVLPAVVPFELRPGSQTRQGTATVGGTVPACFTVTIRGPVTGALSQARVYGPGWSISLTKPVAYDQTVVIDTRTQMVTVNGASSPGLIGPRDRLDARLNPGAQILGFDGSDPSNTARATFAWRDTIPC
ncbi:hypothetical protein G9U51_08265 [Calidifontibacter sp. DB0510]|uniref:Uncharacterized protein n=1 Tax=Metallococcus carri TaxID=1656884 RepID=A0A967AZ53_9MICO|nr:hypothetical protein [Metallococcus carri]NHN55769.1 hypothetical protein [Metallococcus carri]NOP38542.1 hypothetical protein [Calidifontibacter sp. DB2511S]